MFCASARYELSTLPRDAVVLPANINIANCCPVAVRRSLVYGFSKEQIELCPTDDYHLNVIRCHAEARRVRSP